jgi:2-dehydropantoate 2-reductase
MGVTKSPSLNILVVGAGAIGSFVGGSLAAAGHQVTLLGRRPLMDTIQSAGLTLRWPDGSVQTSSPSTATALDDLSPPYDFILLTVKTPDIAAALEQLASRAALAADAHIVTLQNGIGSEEQVAPVFGPERVIAGAITIPIQAPAPGVIEVSKTKGGLGLAPVQPDQPVKRLADALDQAGLTTATYTDYRAMKWSKLLLNIVNNAASAILDLPPADLIARTDLFELEIGALREAVTVMKAHGLQAVKLPGYPVDWLARLVGAGWLPPAVARSILRPFMLSGRGTKMPSLQLDLAAGRSTSEIEALNGAIVRAGQSVGVATPINRALTDILTGLVSGELAWVDYQQKPATLLAAVEAGRQAQHIRSK